MAGSDQSSIGERLRIARTTAGLTQEQAAKAASVARTTLVAIERGERSARAEELVALAGVYGTNTNTLLRKTALSVDLVAQFRRPANSSVKEEDAVEAVRLLHRLATSTVELERRLRKPQSHVYPAERPISRGQVEQQAEDLAIELRTQYGLGLGPLSDIASFAELDLGIRLFFRPIASKIAGVFAFHAEVGACVLVNANHPRERQDITIAHEIAHLLTSRSETDVCLADGQKPASERFADLFAVAFHLPAITIRKRFREVVDSDGKFSARHVLLLADRFHVSTEAMTRRLEKLSLLPEGTFERIRASGLGKRSLRDTVVPLDSSPTPPTRAPLRLAILIAEAHQQELISEAQAAAMLSVDRLEIRRILDELGDADEDLQE